MLFKTNKGKYVEINRCNYTTDIAYYKYLMEFKKKNNMLNAFDRFFGNAPETR